MREMREEAGISLSDLKIKHVEYIKRVKSKPGSKPFWEKDSAMFRVTLDSSMCAKGWPKLADWNKMDPHSHHEHVDWRAKDVLDLTKVL